MLWLTKFAKLGGTLKGAIKEFTKMNGRMPSSAEMNQIETIIKNSKSNVIQFPKQKSSLAELLRTGAVKRGVAPKTTPKDPIDQRWASQEEWAARRKADNKAAIERFENRFGKPEDRASGGRIGYGAGGLISLAKLKKLYPRIHIDALHEASRIKDPKKLHEELKIFRRIEKEIDAAPPARFFHWPVEGKTPHASGGIARVGYGKGKIVTEGLPFAIKKIKDLFGKKAITTADKLKRPEIGRAHV